MALAEAVRPEGKVYTYEIVEKHMRTAAGNIERAGLMPFVEMKRGDVTEGIPESELDCVVLDLATPWLVVGHAWGALTGSGVFLSFSPTVEQVMKTVEELRRHPFIEIETVELILRRITVAPDKTRPETLMVGHSGYLTTARKVVEFVEEG
jgi:tRNA (adenine57-N1/adenine58-N1)-methyltransferase